jgi:uncharacterized delta-60 repeat protein
MFCEANPDAAMMLHLFRRLILPAFLVVSLTNLNAQNWQLVSGVPPTNATAVGAASGSTVYAGFGNNNGVYRSTDNGLNGSPVNTGLVDGFGGAITPTTLFRASSGRIFRGGPNASWNNGVGSPIWYSDNGTSWTQSPYPFVDAASNPGGVALSDMEEMGGALFFSDVLSFAVWKSTDNGLTWTKADNGLPFAPFTGFKFSRGLAKSGTALLSIDPIWGPYRTTNGGASWQPANTGITPFFEALLGNTWPCNDITVAADGTLYVMAVNSLWKSTDTGLTWVQVGAGVFNGGQIRKLTTLGNSIYAAHAIGGGIRVLESTNAGAGWQLMTTNGLTATGVDVLANTFLGHNGALYLADTRGLFRLDVASAARTPIAPIFLTAHGTIGVNVDEAFTLHGHYAGTTPFSYHWYRNGVLVPGVTTSNYVISAATTNHAGEYYLVSSNSAGISSNRVGFLTVAPRTMGSLDYTFKQGFGAVDFFNWTGFFINSAEVTSMARQPDGRIVVVGSFSYVGRGVTPVGDNSVIRTGVARINPDGTVDQSFNAGTGPNVAPDAVVVQSDGKVIVAGDFTVWNGTPVNRIVRLNVDGSIDRSFDTGSGPNARIIRMALTPEGKVVICGIFNMFDGRYRGYIAMLNSNGGLAPGLGERYGLDTWAFALALQSDGRILVGGDFDTAEWITRNRVARFNPDGSLDESFNVGNGPNDRVLHLNQLPDGRIFVGGEFGSVNGASRPRMAILSSTGAVDTNFVPVNLSRDVFASAALGTNFIAVGGDNGLAAVLNFSGSNVLGGVSGNLNTRGFIEEPDGRYLTLAGSDSFGVPGRLMRSFGVSERFGIIGQPHVHGKCADSTACHLSLVEKRRTSQWSKREQPRAERGFRNRRGQLLRHCQQQQCIGHKRRGPSYSPGCAGHHKRHSANLGRDFPWSNCRRSQRHCTHHLALEEGQRRHYECQQLPHLHQCAIFGQRTLLRHREQLRRRCHDKHSVYCDTSSRTFGFVLYTCKHCSGGGLQSGCGS